MSALQVYLDGIGVYAPGLNGWDQARSVLAAPQAYQATPLQLPAIESLPAAERRRLGLSVKLAMASGYDAVRQLAPDAVGQLATVFASSAGDCDNCHQLLESLAAAEPSISPTRFHNAVHNAAAGYWSIATGSRQPSTSLSAWDAGFAAALLEASSQVLSSGQACLLVAFDTPYPQPLHALRPIACPFGVALLLTPQRSAHSLARLQLALAPDPATTLSDPAMESMRSQVPSARALPLLTALATPTPTTQTLVLEYLAGLNLVVELAIDLPS